MSLLIISRNYWGANLSEHTAKRFEYTFRKIIETNNEKYNIEKLIGNNVNIINVKNKISKWINKQSKIDNMLFIYVNGHGNQILDSSHEEKDGMDELLQLPDGNLIDDELTRIINDAIPDDINKKPIIFLISDHCSSGSMLDKSDNLKYDWITVGSSLDNQDSLMTGEGNVMTSFLIDIIENLDKKSLSIVNIKGLFEMLSYNMKNSFIGDLQIPTLNMSNNELDNINIFRIGYSYK